MERVDGSSKLTLDGRIYLKTPGNDDIMVILPGQEKKYAKKLNDLIYRHLLHKITTVLNRNDDRYDLIPEDSEATVLRKTSWAPMSKFLWIDGSQKQYPARELLAKEATRVKITVEILKHED